MNDLLHLGQTGTDDDLPFCFGDGCTACAIAELQRDLAFYGDDGSSEVSITLGRVYFRDGSVRGEEQRREQEREEDEWTMRAELYAESAWERHAERYDPEAQADLAWHNELWPTYYGCPTDPGAAL